VKDVLIKLVRGAQIRDVLQSRKSNGGGKKTKCFEKSPPIRGSKASNRNHEQGEITQGGAESKDQHREKTNFRSNSLEKHILKELITLVKKKNPKLIIITIRREK